MKKKIILIVSIMLLAVLITATFSACNALKFSKFDVVDLSNRPDFVKGSEYDYLYDLTIVDDNADYMAHPDSVLLKDSGKEKIMTMYVLGHGKGQILTKVSEDKGLTYSDRLTTTPQSWKKSEETPTIYALNMSDGSLRHVMVSANPKWGDYEHGDGFNASISFDNCKTWTEFEKYYGYGEDGFVEAIVAMSSMIQVKENGKFIDKWMGIFHDGNYNNFRTYLTFDENNKMCWSKPEKYFKGANNESYDELIVKSGMCEVCIFRSEFGKGDRIWLLTRSNTKKYNSLLSYSDDEGQTWAKPKEAPDSLNGERHKVVFTKDGRLVITFRSIIRDSVRSIFNSGKNGWYSLGWLAWVGTYEDLENWYNGDKKAIGQYDIKLAHTYLPKQKEPQEGANADCGYCGNVIFEDGMIVSSTYGCFDKDKFVEDGSKLKTSIASKRFKLEDIDKIYDLMKTNEK